MTASLAFSGGFAFNTGIPLVIIASAILNMAHILQLILNLEEQYLEKHGFDFFVNTKI